MRSTQHDCLALVQENQSAESSCTTLQGEVDALIQCLQTRAKHMNKKRRTRNDRAHWIARGRQQALRCVSVRLFALEATYVASYTLYLALQEYLDCLGKYWIDAEEERQAVEPRNGLPIEQWKAEGEAYELPRIAHALSSIVQAHAPDSVRHTLSLDGKHLVSLSKSRELTCSISLAHIG